MASEFKSLSAVVPLNGMNLSTMGLQCRMTLMKERLWNVVARTEAAPVPENDRQFLTRRNRALQQ